MRNAPIDHSTQADAEVIASLDAVAADLRVAGGRSGVVELAIDTVLRDLGETDLSEALRAAVASAPMNGALHRLALRLPPHQIEAIDRASAATGVRKMRVLGAILRLYQPRLAELVNDRRKGQPHAPHEAAAPASAAAD